VTTYTFRQSWLGTFFRCPEQARVEMFEGAKREETDSTAKGTSVHAAIEYALEEGDPTGEIGHDIIDRKLAELQPWKYTKYGVERVHKLAHAAYDNWRELIAPEVEPLHVEWGFEVEFPYCKHDVILQGTSDCIDRRGLVWDWKTAGKPYERWEYQRWAVQPTVYTYAATAELGATFDEFHYGIMLDSGDVQLMSVTRGPEHYEWLGRQIDRICDLIEADLPHWPLNDTGWHCSPRWCGNWDNCKGALFNEDWTARVYDETIEETGAEGTPTAA
jgi:hypothetical protein